MDNDNICLFDMDDTLCDFSGAMTAMLRSLMGPNETLRRSDGVDYVETRENLIKSMPGFWRNLRPLRTGFDVYGIAYRLGYQCHILTKGPANRPAAWAEKLEWCRAHFSDAPVTITQDKGLVYGRVLVDDHPEYIRRWIKWRPRGIVLMPTTNANAFYKPPARVTRVGRHPKSIMQAEDLLREQLKRKA